MPSERLPLDFPNKNLFCDIFQDRVFLVGGSVRDLFLNGRINERRDIDLLVIGSTYEEIEKQLAPLGKTSNVGKSFAVVKFTLAGRNLRHLGSPQRQKKSPGIPCP